MSTLPAVVFITDKELLRKHLLTIMDEYRENAGEDRDFNKEILNLIGKGTES